MNYFGNNLFSNKVFDINRIHEDQFLFQMKKRSISNFQFIIKKIRLNKIYAYFYLFQTLVIIIKLRKISRLYNCYHYCIVPNIQNIFTKNMKALIIFIKLNLYSKSTYGL